MKPTHLLMIYNYPHSFIDIKSNWKEGYDKEVLDNIELIPIKLDEILNI